LKIKPSKVASFIAAMAMRELSQLNRDSDGDEEVWVKHYSSNHQILLVGEGDFSFSHSLATLFGSASNICASSLDSYGNTWFTYIVRAFRVFLFRFRFSFLCFRF